MGGTASKTTARKSKKAPLTGVEKRLRKRLDGRVRQLNKWTRADGHAQTVVYLQGVQAAAELLNATVGRKIFQLKALPDGSYSVGEGNVVDPALSQATRLLRRSRPSGASHTPPP